MFWSGPSIHFYHYYILFNHFCINIHAISCEKRPFFKGDLIKFCEIFTKVTLELPQNSQKPLFKCKKLVTNTTTWDLCLFLHKMCWKFCEIWKSYGNWLHNGSNSERLYLTVWGMACMHWCNGSKLQKWKLTRKHYNWIWTCPICATSGENLFMPYANNKGADQPAHPLSRISTFIVRCLNPKLQDSSSVAEQIPGCKPPKTGFLVMQVIW